MEVRLLILRGGQVERQRLLALVAGLAAAAAAVTAVAVEVWGLTW